MDGCTYSFETVGNSTRSAEMLKTGQIPMEVNTVPGLIVYKSEDEKGEMSGDALQTRDNCLFCKKTGHQKRDCRSYEEWKEKNPNRKTENTNRKPVPCFNSGKEGQISRDCRSERQDSGWKDEHQNQGGGYMAEMAMIHIPSPPFVINIVINPICKSTCIYILLYNHLTVLTN